MPTQHEVDMMKMLREILSKWEVTNNILTHLTIEVRKGNEILISSIKNSNEILKADKSGSSIGEGE